MKINIIKINSIINGSFDENNYKKIYKINLDDNKKYFINLISTNNIDINSRIFDKDKNIIKLKNDINEILNYESWYQIENDIESKNNVDSKGKQTEDVELSNNINDINNEDSNVSLDESSSLIVPDNFNDIINDILLKCLKENNDDIEIVLEYEKTDTNKITEEDIKIKNDKFKNKPKNFNNKIYFSPKYTGEYFILISSDYIKTVVDYYLHIQEVEDINEKIVTTININKNIKFNSIYKFNSKLFNVLLHKDVEYCIQSKNNVIFLIFYKDQNIISNNNMLKIKTKYKGNYNIEVISLCDDKTINFKIK